MKNMECNLIFTFKYNLLLYILILLLNSYVMQFLYSGKIPKFLNRRLKEENFFPIARESHN